MVDRQTRSDIGRAAARKGKQTELRLAAYLRNHGWPDANRTVRTGWRTATREDPDVGDIRGAPGLVWQAKSGATMSDLDIETALADTIRQAVAADYGILVLRRTGKTDVGKWWAYLPGRDIFALLNHGQPLQNRAPVLDKPWRTHVEVVVELLHLAGYGETT